MSPKKKVNIYLMNKRFAQLSLNSVENLISESIPANKTRATKQWVKAFEDFLNETNSPPLKGKKILSVEELKDLEGSWCNFITAARK